MRRGQVADLRAGMVGGLRAIHDKVAFVFVLTRIACGYWYPRAGRNIRSVRRLSVAAAVIANRHGMSARTHVTNIG